MNHPLDPLLAALARLAPPVANAYFHGQLLGVAHFRREQEYHKVQDWQQNLLLTGGGIFAGLQVTPDDARSPFRLTVAPGLAVDPLGRRIVVPHPDPAAGVPPAEYEIAPDHPGLKAFLAAHPPGADPFVCDVYAAYRDEAIDLAPERAGDCDALRRYSPGATRETYTLSVEFPLPPPAAAPDPCEGDASVEVFPAEPPPGHDPRPALRRRYHQSAPEWPAADLTPAKLRVHLARVHLVWDAAGRTVRAAEAANEPNPSWGVRREVLTACELVDLVVRLSARVNELQRQLIPSCHDGDAQEADSFGQLPKPIEVAVHDSADQLKSGVRVKFRVTGGGGMVRTRGGGNDDWRCELTADTVAGIAGVEWKVGKHGLQTVEAAVALAQPDTLQTRSVGRHVKFVAWANSLNLPTPVVQHLLPDDVARQNWPASPDLLIQFSREMDVGQLRAETAWLRLWRVRAGYDPQYARLERLGLTFRDQHEVRVDTAKAWEVRYDVARPPGGAAWARDDRILVIMHAEGSNIQSTGRVLLDPAFAGTKLTPEQLRHVWDCADDHPQFPVPFAQFERSGSSPPSGGGEPRGWFHASFRLR